MASFSPPASSNEDARREEGEGAGEGFLQPLPATPIPDTTDSSVAPAGRWNLARFWPGGAGGFTTPAHAQPPVASDTGEAESVDGSRRDNAEEEHHAGSDSPDSPQSRANPVSSEAQQPRRQWVIASDMYQVDEDLAEAVTLTQEEMELLLAHRSGLRQTGAKGGETPITGGGNASQTPTPAPAFTPAFTPPAPTLPLRQDDTPSTDRGPALQGIDLEGNKTANVGHTVVGTLEYLTKMQSGQSSAEHALDVSQQLAAYAAKASSSNMMDLYKNSTELAGAFFDRRSRITAASKEATSLVTTKSPKLPRVDVPEGDHSKHDPDFMKKCSVPHGCHHKDKISYALYTRQQLHELPEMLAGDGILLLFHLNELPPLRMSSTAAQSELNFQAIKQNPKAAEVEGQTRVAEAYSNCLAAVILALEKNHSRITDSLKTTFKHLSKKDQLKVLLLQVCQLIVELGWKNREGLLLYLIQIAQYIPPEGPLRFTSYLAYWEKVISFYVDLDLDWKDHISRCGIAQQLRQNLCDLHESNDMVIQLLAQDRDVLLNEGAMHFLDTLNKASVLERQIPRKSLAARLPGASSSAQQGEEEWRGSSTTAGAGAKAATPSPSTNTFDKACYNCGQTGHLRKDCPAKPPSTRQQLAMLTSMVTDLTTSLASTTTATDCSSSSSAPTIPCATPTATAPAAAAAPPPSTPGRHALFAQASARSTLASTLVPSPQGDPTPTRHVFMTRRAPVSSTARRQGDPGCVYGIDRKVNVVRGQARIERYAPESD